MNGNCHFIYGASIGSMIALNLDKISNIFPHITNTPETATLFVLGGLIGGILPDIDSPNSHIGKLSTPLSTVINAIQSKFDKVASNHRGILHDPLVYIIGVILSYLFMPSLLGIFIGCLSHLFLDMFNPSGIPFFIFFNACLGKIKSGDSKSIIFTWICIAVCLLLGISYKCFA